MHAPQRIKLRRSAGWRKPEDAIVVARPTKWGNPFRITPHDTGQRAVDAYREWRAQPDQVGLVHAARAVLGGHDLACWCGIDRPCYADVLLEVSNP